MVNENIKNMVEKPHPILSRYIGSWNFFISSYEGGIDYTGSEIAQSDLKDSSIRIEVNGKEWSTYTSSNLFKHPKEKDADYNARKRMSYYYNFCAPIIDIYTDHLFKQPIAEDFGNLRKTVDFRRENIDRMGSSIGEFRKQVADLAGILGHVFVINDSPANDGNVITFRDVIDNDLFPYFSIVLPQNVINWSLDRFSMPYWVLVREIGDVNIDPFSFNRSAADNINYRLWTRQEWILFNKAYEEIDRGVHGLGRVPITCIFDRQSKKAPNFLGISSLADIAFIAKDIYNSCSLKAQILRDQTFAILALQGDAKDYDAVSVGTSKGLVHPEGTNTPAYVSPDPENARVIQEHINEQIRKIFQIAKLEGGSVQQPTQSATVESGASKAWDFNQTNSALAKKAGNLEDGETKLWQMFGLWEGQEFDGSIQYPDEFSIQSLKQDMDEAQQAMGLSLGKTFDNAVKAAIIKKKFPRMNESDLNKMISEMEKQQASLSVGGGLVQRRPDLFNKPVVNANSGGK